MKDNNINKVPYTTFEIEQPKKPIKTLEQFQEYKKKQDMKDSETLEEIRNNDKRIKEGQLLIKSTLEKQEPLLTHIDEDMDRIDNKMVRSENVMKKYLEKTSDSCLYWTIGIELVLLFLFFML